MGGKCFPNSFGSTLLLNIQMRVNVRNRNQRVADGLGWRPQAIPLHTVLQRLTCLQDGDGCRVLLCLYGSTLPAGDYPGDIGNDIVHCLNLLACGHTPLLAGVAVLGSL